MQKLGELTGALWRERVNGDVHLVEACSAHKGRDFTLRYLQIADAAMAQIALASGQAVFVVRVALHVVAPALAPEGVGYLAIRKGFDGLDILALLAQLGHLLGRLVLLFRHRDIGAKAAVSVIGHATPPQPASDQAG